MQGQERRGHEGKGHNRRQDQRKGSGGVKKREEVMIREEDEGEYSRVGRED